MNIATSRKITDKSWRRSRALNLSAWRRPRCVTALRGELDFGHGAGRVLDDFCLFHRDHANEPSGDKAAWVLELMRSSGLCPAAAVINFALGKNMFRADIFAAASALRHASTFKPEPEPEAVLA